MVWAATLALLSAANQERSLDRRIPTYLARRHQNDDTLVDRWGPYFAVPDVNFSRPVENEAPMAASMNVQPPIVVGYGKVSVNWVGVTNVGGEGGTDWIGIYCPATSGDEQFLDWFYGNLSPTYSQGYGSVTVFLTDPRADCQFRYFTHKAGSAYSLVAKASVSFEPGAPIYGHLALTGDPSEMLLSFATNVPVTPMVKYGTSPDKMEFTATGTSRTYRAGDMCGPPANTSGFLTAGYFHTVVMTKLQARTKYFYSYGSQGKRFSEAQWFVSAPKVDPDYGFKFVTYADMGTFGGDSSAMTAILAQKEVEQNACEFILHPGDVSYALGTGYIWDRWFAMVEPYSSRVPYMIGIGNHEYDHDSGGEHDPSGAPGTGFHPSWGNFGDDSLGECGVPMHNRFTMPKNGNSLFWYSYDYGSVHFVMVSTEHDCSLGSPQYQWLVQDLMSVNRARTPWVILAGHRPMYNSEKYAGDFKVAQNMQLMYEDVLDKYQVDIAIWGHYHAYERTCPVYLNKCKPAGQATTHITIGSAGYVLDNVDLYGFEWSLFFSKQYGYGRITIANRTHMLWEYVQNHDGQVKDKVWLRSRV